MGTGRKGTVAGKVYLRRADVLRVATMLPVFVGGLRRRSGLQPPEAEVDGNGCSSDDVRAMVRIRRRSSVRDDPDVAAAVRATLAAGEEHEVIEEEMGPANQRWVRVRAGWLLDGAGGGGGDEEEEEAEESKEEEEGGSAAAADLSQSIATSGFPDISSLGGLGAPTSASAAAAAATCPTSPLARPSAPVPGLSPSRPGSATTETAAAAPAEADAAAALEFFHIPADTRPGAKPGAASPAAGEAGEGAEGAWLAHIDGKLFFKCTPQMAPFDMAILSAATLRVERVFRLLLFGCVEEEDDEDDDAAAPAPAQAAEEQDGGGPRPGLDGPAAVEPAAAVGEPTTVEHATVHAGVRVRAEDAHVTQMAGILHGSQLGLAPPAEQRVLMDAGEASDGWRGFPLPAAEAPETTALRTLTLDLGEPRVLTRLGAVFHVGPGARLVLVFLFVSPDGRDFQAWPDPASPATSPQGENPESPYFVAARAPVFARFVRFSFALDHGGEGMWVQRLHAQGPPQAAAEVGGSAVAASHGAAAPASSPRTPAPVIPGFTTDGRGLYVVYGTPNDDTGVATVDPEADGAAGTTLHVCGWDPGTYCVDGGHFSVRASAEDRPLLLLKGLFTNGHQLLVLSGDSARTTAARGSAPTYTAAAYGISRWRWAEMEITKPEQCRFVFEGGSSSSGGLPAATPSFLPQAFAYDAHNNVVWGAELFAEGGGKVASWSNVGNLAPPIYPPEMDNLNDWELSLVPEKRRETLLYLATRAEGERDAQEDRVSSSAAAQLQAAIILSCLDHCAEPYGAAGGGGLGLGSPAAGPSLAPLSAADHGSQELVVSAAGKEEGLSQRRARFVVQGRALTSCAPGAAFERGLNLVRLDAGYEPVETRGFDTTGRSGAGTVYNDLLLEYVSRLPEGTVVLVASQEDAGRGLTPTGQEALQMLGGDGALVAGLRAAPNDSSYALIGRKGARHTSARVVQRLGRRGGHASVRLRLSVVPVPLCVEPSSPTLRALVRVVLAHKDAALAAGPCTLTEKCRAGHVLSALSLLTTNIHVLMRACPPAAAATVAAQQLRGLFDPEELYDLQDFLLEVLGAPPTPPTLLGPHLGEAALRLFVTALDIFHPTPSGQCALLTQLMGRYAEGALSLLEASVLGLLLKRIANPSSLLALMLNPGAGLCLDLFRTILAIAEGESTAALAKLSTASIAARTLRAAAPSAELASHGIGHAALTMLASLTNKLLCLTAHGALFASKTIAASKGKDIGVSYTAQSIHGDSIAALLHVVGALGTSCQTLLDAALAVLEEQQEQEEEGEGGGVDGRDAASAATARMERALSRASSLSLSPSRSGLARASSTASLSSKGGGHGQPQRWRDLEAALQASPFGALLPLLVLVVTELARYEVPALLPALRRLVLALSSLAQRVHRLVAYLPASAAAAAGTRVAAVGGCTTRQQVFESAHPYLPYVRSLVESLCVLYIQSCGVFGMDGRVARLHAHLIKQPNQHVRQEHGPDLYRALPQGGAHRHRVRPADAHGDGLRFHAILQGKHTRWVWGDRDKLDDISNYLMLLSPMPLRNTITGRRPHAVLAPRDREVLRAQRQRDVAGLWKSPAADYRGRPRVLLLPQR